MVETSAIGREALKPNPLLTAFAFLIGEWQTTGTHPQLPGKTFHGLTSFAWAEGGAFLIMRSEIDEPEIPSGVALIGSDDGDHSYVMIYFDERGVSRHYQVTISDDEMIWNRDDPKLAQCMTFTREDGGDRIVCKGRMSEDGGAWKDDLSLTYTRLNS